MWIRQIVFGLLTSPSADFRASLKLREIRYLTFFSGFGSWKIHLALRDDCGPYLGVRDISGPLMLYSVDMEETRCLLDFPLQAFWECKGERWRLRHARVGNGGSGTLLVFRAASGRCRVYRRRHRDRDRTGTTIGTIFLTICFSVCCMWQGFRGHMHMRDLAPATVPSFAQYRVGSLVMQRPCTASAILPFRPSPPFPPPGPPFPSRPYSPHFDPSCPSTSPSSHPSPP